MIRGRLLLVMKDERHMLDPSDSIRVRRGVPHYFRNGHEGETLYTARLRPARQAMPRICRFGCRRACSRRSGRLPCSKAIGWQ